VKVLIDSNIPMYVAGAGHPIRDPARLFLRRVRTGELAQLPHFLVPDIVFSITYDFFRH
jgi:hypothetical protein